MNSQSPFLQRYLSSKMQNYEPPSKQEATNRPTRRRPAHRDSNNDGKEPVREKTIAVDSKSSPQNISELFYLDFDFDFLANLVNNYPTNKKKISIH